MADMCRWYIADGYLPSFSTGQLESHESLCVLNTTEQAAMLHLTVYFEDRSPIMGFRFNCPAKRTVHVRLDAVENDDGESIPRGVPYAMEIESTVPVVVQHSRMDTSQKALALFTTMGFSQ
ncbi:hypothetical protein C7445_1149 [Alicyclobacillus sacchari]|uniref:Sensory rhodopsin transducer n=1 Tax=Alicyclobacillus sacchari TaxID=392010 RepID=A0A4R8LJF4_9BACL|nr:sensory rhodopsin transducer [Alicyclobacillus sacchari]TDY42576.1 hypothetical protein C7445_1149 [Alicyclobacillus sacchari]GMA58114.1 hypothetical protein GCM10025858_26170 [Alicyclobacillus sacchari]